MRRIAALAVFISAVLPALAAVETTTITGKVLIPGGSGAPYTAGSITAALSTAGTASDGASFVVISGRVSATIASDGTVSIVLVPNDVITPISTYYLVKFNATAPTPASWAENWVVVTTPDPIALGAVARVNTPPGLAAPISFVLDEGTALTRRTKLNFTGSAVACADNAGQSRVDCTITGGAAPVTTKGDLYGFSSVVARVPVGTDGYVLRADSAAALGVSYMPAIKVTETSPADAHLLLYDSALVPSGYANKALSGDATITTAGVATIANGAVSAAKMGANVVGFGQLDYSATLTAPDPALGAKQCVFDATDGQGGIVCEGTTANGFETMIVTGTPGTSADLTITMPNNSAAGGSINLAAIDKTSSQTWSGANVWNGASTFGQVVTVTGASSAFDATTMRAVNGVKFSDGYADIATAVAALPSSVPSNGVVRIDPDENDATTLPASNLATTTTGKRGAVVVDTRNGSTRWMSSKDEYGVYVTDAEAVPFSFGVQFDDAQHFHRDQNADGALDSANEGCTSAGHRFACCTGAGTGTCTGATNEWSSLLNEGNCSTTTEVHCTQKSDCLNDADHCSICIANEYCTNYSGVIDEGQYNNSIAIADVSRCTSNGVPFACCTGAAAGTCTGWGVSNRCSTTTATHCYEDKDCPGVETCSKSSKRYWYSGHCNTNLGVTVGKDANCAGPLEFAVFGPQHAGSGNDKKPVFGVGSAGVEILQPEHINTSWNSWLTMFRNDEGNGDLSKANTAIYVFSRNGLYADGNIFSGGTGLFPEYSPHIYPQSGIWSQKDIEASQPGLVSENDTNSGAGVLGPERSLLIQAVDTSGGRDGFSGANYYHGVPFCSADPLRTCTNDASCGSGTCYDWAAQQTSGTSKAKGRSAFAFYANSVMLLGSYQTTSPSLTTDQRIVYTGLTSSDANYISVGLAEDPTGARAIDYPNVSGRLAAYQSSNSHGGVFFGVRTATDAAFDTGDEVCVAAGLVCVTTNDVLGTGIACTTAHVVIDQWLAFCKKA